MLTKDVYIRPKPDALASGDQSIMASTRNKAGEVTPTRTGEQTSEGGPDTEYLSAKDAARALGVSIQTLYVYVGRKGIRSQPIAGSRRRRYWRADIERAIRGEKITPSAIDHLRQESKITLITDRALFYRGVNVEELAQHATFEATASLLWGCAEQEAFTAEIPTLPRTFTKLSKLLAEESDTNRAMSLLPLFEECNPRAYDLSPPGMARTGADVLRALAAIAVGAARPLSEPLHQFIARHINANSLQTELIRRQLVLAADHGFEPGTVAVRALASTGVTPWRSVIAGLAVILGRRTALSRWNAAGRLLAEIINNPNPAQPILERVRAGEPVPGFHPSLHTHSDPRARALFDFCASALAKDSAYQRVAEAVAAAKSTQGLEPNFALAFLFVDGKTGVGPRRSLFHVGRCAGWIAHAIEQFQTGESERAEGVYQGTLPA
jgi:citrate synthase